MKKVSYKFERIPKLRLLDLKAQKKSINFKKFMDIPLTFEETIAEGIANSRSATEMNTTHDNFIIRKRRIPKSSEKYFHRLAMTKQS